MIGKAVYWLLGGVELLVDGYHAVERLVTRREKPIPLGKPKVRDLLERQARAGAADPRSPSPPAPPSTVGEPPPVRTGIRSIGRARPPG